MQPGNDVQAPIVNQKEPVPARATQAATVHQVIATADLQHEEG